MAKYENIVFARNENKLTMEVDLNTLLALSSTGKSKIIARTNGQAGIKLMAKEGGELCRVKLLVYKVNKEEENNDAL